MALTSGLSSSGGSKSALIARLKTAIAKEKNATKKTRLTEQLNKLIKPASAGKPGKPGDAMAKYASIKSYTPKGNEDKSAFGKFVGTLADYSYKKPDYTTISKEAARDVDPSRFNYLDPFGNYQDVTMGAKKGGRLKKAKKKSKKSRPKGVRIALRGYGKAMGRG
tara:strand:+ start:121 stop:615 length:495 start_codon:yes stop_codon:yes gene_type:complete